jgi:hypothetical protein
MHEVSIESTVSSVRSLINQAQRSARSLARHEDYGYDDWWQPHTIVVSLHEAYTQLLILAEALGLDHMYDMIRKSYDEADGREGGVAALETDPEGDTYLAAEWELKRFVSSIDAVYGIASPSVVSKDLIEVLRATQYAITDRNCFSEPPASEDDVHHRIEAVLRCVFPDLDHEPPVPKAVKHFRPDTGLPSMRTLIEYKFIRSKADVGPVADQILADTRGYQSAEWDKFIFLIYETHRLRRESEWNRLLRQCGTASNTQAIVICGESPKQESPRKKVPARKRKASKPQKGPVGGT